MTSVDFSRSQASEPAPFCIVATPATSLQRPQILKAADTFLVADQYGDLSAAAPCAEGLFHADTRYLSKFALTLNGSRFLLLSSNVTQDSEALRVHLTNPDFSSGAEVIVERDSIHLLRTATLEPGCLTIRSDIRSYTQRSVEITLVAEFECDFADIFEVRGFSRHRRGYRLAEQVDASTVLVAYRGLDEAVRCCRIAFDGSPDAIDSRHARYRMTLPPQGAATLNIRIACWVQQDGQAKAGPLAHPGAGAQSDPPHVAPRAVETSKELLNHWIARSHADLNMLITQKPQGLYPYAGIPWFSTAFGRDGLITALQCLWCFPELARGVLGYLAATQATRFDASSDAESGKILHEERRGEMAALGEVPFGRYYGSVDATPLFVMLAAGYWSRTNDIAFARTLWPHVQAALGWMSEYGDRDKDDFLEYARLGENGLVNQGWKDSDDSVFHRDGKLAEGPIAPVEVQAYAYEAWLGASRLAHVLGYADDAAAYAQAAERLRQKFEQLFWCEDLETYALALDGAKRPCKVRSSNAGHALFSGIVSPERARHVAETLMSERGFSGWGIRTIAEGEPRYNPISYHNGSVWPHDNGLIALGFSRFGLHENIMRILEGLLEASEYMDLHRMPELFCGFPRRPGDIPVRYPVACIPQAWSAASVFAVLGALLGISFDISSKRVILDRPSLPPSVTELRLSGITVGDGHIDLLLRRHSRDVAVNVLAKTGNVELVLISG